MLGYCYSAIGGDAWHIAALRGVVTGYWLFEKNTL